LSIPDHPVITTFELRREHEGRWRAFYRTARQFSNVFWKSPFGVCDYTS
jgi:hypothetical protein